MPKFKKNSAEAEVPAASYILKSGDLVPSSPFPLQHLIPTVHSISQRFGYRRVEPSPIVSLEQFSKQRGVSPVSEEDMLTVSANGSKRYALRPQNFLSVLRTYLDYEAVAKEKITKWYYLEPAFAAGKNSFEMRYEVGWVHFGESNSLPDAQLLMMLKVLMEELGLSQPIFEINNRGCESCTSAYRDALADYLNQNKFSLCEKCQEAISFTDEKNTQAIYGVFKCEKSQCQSVAGEAPQIIDYLDTGCNKHLTSLLETLDELEVPYQLNPRLFGHDWQSGSIFGVRLFEEEKNFDTLTLGYGGRNSSFVSSLTGRDIPTLSFSLPFERLLETIDNRKATLRPNRMADVFLINLGELAVKKSLRLFLELWKNGITVLEQFGENGIKNQFKLAESNACPIALVIGQKEALDGSVILRDVRNGTQEVFAYDRIIEEVKKRLQE